LDDETESRIDNEHVSALAWLRLLAHTVISIPGNMSMFAIGFHFMFMGIVRDSPVYAVQSIQHELVLRRLHVF